jgi:hypothetical protein
MKTSEIESPDTINGMSLVLLKYIIEQLGDAVLERVEGDDEWRELLVNSFSGKVKGDDFQRIVMGYCVSEPGALKHNINIVMKMLGNQVEALQDSIGG